MAYSSIAHAGYMLVGLAVGDAEPVSGTDAVLFYLATYGLMTIGVFALSAVSPAGRSTTSRPESLAADDRAPAGRLPVEPHGPAADGRLLRQAELVPRRVVGCDHARPDAGRRHGA